MLCHLPSLHTVACGLRDAFSALTASPALVVSYLQHAHDTAQPHSRQSCNHLPGSHTLTATSAQCNHLPGSHTLTATECSVRPLPGSLL